MREAGHKLRGGFRLAARAVQPHPWLRCAEAALSPAQPAVQLSLQASGDLVLLSKHTCQGCRAFQALGCTARAAKIIPFVYPGRLRQSHTQSSKACLYPRF